MNTPFNTGKVLIGCNYHPQHTWQPTRTEAMLQSALLAHKHDKRIDWDGITIVQIYRLYRRKHSTAYALRRAFEISFKGIPF